MNKLDKIVAGTVAAGTLLCAAGVLFGAGRFVNRHYINLDKYTANAKAEINYTEAPQKWQEGDLAGEVILTDAIRWDYRVATFIEVNGRWWPKPYWNKQFTSIAYDGTFRTKIFTGARDAEDADAIYSAVVRRDYSKVKDGTSISKEELPTTADKRVLAVVKFERKSKEEKNE